MRNWESLLFIPISLLLHCENVAALNFDLVGMRRFFSPHSVCLRAGEKLSWSLKKSEHNRDFRTFAGPSASDLEIKIGPTLSPRQLRLAKNIASFKDGDGRKRGPSLPPSRAKQLELPKSFDAETASTDLILEAIRVYESRSAPLKIQALLESLNARRLLSADGGALFRQAILALIRLRRFDLARAALLASGVDALEDLAFSDARAEELYRFLRALCQNSLVDAAVFLVDKFEIMSRSDTGAEGGKSRAEAGGQAGAEPETEVSFEAEEARAEGRSAAGALAVGSEGEAEAEAEAAGARATTRGSAASGAALSSWPELLPKIHAAICRGHVKQKQWAEARAALAAWRASDGGSKRLGVPAELGNGLLKDAAAGRHLPTFLEVLETIGAVGMESDEETNEIIAQAAVQSVSFITGAVSLASLPKASLPEVAFVGRSNVGKSSLVNMVIGRKAMAYTSKTPGKTQQFNYFAVNAESKWDPSGAFYLVDLPGVGFAKVPKAVRAKWAGFMREYLYERATLKVVFHLVDSRTGPVAADEELMRVMAGAPAHVEYVIVLTKADKRESKWALRASLEGVRTMLTAAGCDSNTAILLTSSESKLGRDHMWRFMRLAADPGSFGLPK